MFTSALVRVGDGRDCQVVGGEVPQASQHALKKKDDQFCGEEKINLVFFRCASSVWVSE